MRSPSLRLVAVLAALFLSAGSVYAEPGIRFQLGFKMLADQIPSVVGEPLEEEHFDPSTGDMLQRTTTGLMVWRKADNWTAFTDGSRTWVNGPQGLQERSNAERFAWEAPQVKIAMLQQLPDSGFDSAAEQVGLDLINQSRLQNGLAPLAMDDALRRLARARASDMSARGYFSHISPDGTSPFDLMKAEGVAFSAAAENIASASGYRTGSDVVRSSHGGMMAETPPADGHRKNILDPNLHKVGIGVYTGKNGKTYYVCDFTD